MNSLAQESIPLGTLEGLGELGLEGAPEEAGTILNSLLSGTIGLITIIAGIWFIFLFIFGAIGIMTASGDKAQLESARTRLQNGLLGLFIVVAGIFVVELIGSLLGLDFILNPAEFIDNFQIGGP